MSEMKQLADDRLKELEELQRRYENTLKVCKYLFETDAVRI